MYKRVRCRHFDPTSGKPLSSGCSKGKSCPFIHPDDSNWRNARKDSPRTPLASQPYAFRNRPRDISSSPRQHRDSRTLGRAKEMRGLSNSSDRVFQNFHRDEASRSEHGNTAIGRRYVQRKDTAIVKTEEIQDQMRKEKIDVENVGSNEESSGQVWNAFLQIARLTRESDILDEQQKKEESKMATYAAVEKTLNEISNQMGLAVMPQIDQSTVIQQDCKKTIAQNKETVNRLCKEVVQLFVADVTNAVDKRVQPALQNLRDEAVSLIKEMQKWNCSSSGVGSRWEGRGGLGRSWSPQDERTKRRRTSPYSPRSRNGTEVMKELEAKIERQAQALINLTKENEKLRVNLESRGSRV